MAEKFRAKRVVAKKFIPKTILMCMVIVFFPAAMLSQEPSGIVRGKVVDAGDGSPLAGCEVISRSGRFGTVADSLGEYQLRLPYGTYDLAFYYLGYLSARHRVTVKADQASLALDVRLTTQPLHLPGTTVTARRQENAAPAFQVEALDIRQMPTLHNDVIRSVKILPGVSSNNELGSAYNVRGGNYDENLIYLNGYEIFRPYLLRSGAEESQTIVNGDMVRRLTFYAGGFPAQYGDRMSSALDVDYRLDGQKKLSGTARASLLGSGISARQQIGKLSWNAGVRYSNPALFLNRLQEQGDYQPYFRDIQLLLNWQPTAKTQLEFFGLAAANQFDLTPQKWIGDFQVRRLDVRRITIDYDGYRNYQFATGLAGLRLRRQVGAGGILTASIARFANSETDEADINSRILYSPDATKPNQNQRQLKTAVEQANNRLDMFYDELAVSYSQRRKSAVLQAGLNWQRHSFDSRIDEYYREFGDSALLQTPRMDAAASKIQFDYPQGYAQLNWQFGPRTDLTVGLRGFYYGLNNVFRLSPRAALRYQATETDFVSLAIGEYYQPPGYHELRLRSEDEAANLGTQRARHFILGWERPAGRGKAFRGEFFVKQLDDLLPFYQEELVLKYGDQNNYQGYAAGVDLQIRGEFVPGANSWASYSYLVSREKPQDAERYTRRLLDQAHTLRLFLQENAPRHKFIRSHLRLLFGSGFLYRPRTIQIDPQSGESVLAIDFDRLYKFTHYARVDLGITVTREIGESRQAVFTLEVLNLFDHRNTVSNSWYQIFPENPNPFRVAHLLSPRFFNLSAEIHY